MSDVQEALDQLAQDDEQYLTRHDDGTVTVHLETPVEYRNGKREPTTIEEVKFRRTKGRDWAATDKAKGDISKTMHLASSVSGLPLAAFNEMDGDDFLRCVRVVNSMGKFPNAGGTS